MSELKIFSDSNPTLPLASTRNVTEIARRLAEEGVRFEQWQAAQPVKAGDSSELVRAAYRADIERLCREDGYVTVDVISLNADHPDKAALRQKFLSEHRHSEDEVRFFVDGHGLFSLHINDKVYEVLCEKGDLISVPANATHWFDMGPNPHFVAIRFFNNPEGWVAKYSGSDIADRFARLEN